MAAKSKAAKSKPAQPSPQDSVKLQAAKSVPPQPPTPKDSTKPEAAKSMPPQPASPEDSTKPEAAKSMPPQPPSPKVVSHPIATPQQGRPFVPNQGPQAAGAARPADSATSSDAKATAILATQMPTPTAKHMALPPPQHVSRTEAKHAPEWQLAVPANASQPVFNKTGSAPPAPATRPLPPASAQENQSQADMVQMLQEAMRKIQKLEQDLEASKAGQAAAGMQTPRTNEIFTPQSLARTSSVATEPDDDDEAEDKAAASDADMIVYPDGVRAT